MQLWLTDSNRLVKYSIVCRFELLSIFLSLLFVGENGLYLQICDRYFPKKNPTKGSHLQRVDWFLRSRGAVIRMES